ncbi:MAG TPA: phosphoribosylglycinamide synthetase C domain-containing protein, partial [Oceanobacillus sp.]|nr:phosphoribosylglycinamide synthetase C domain-containing protein [Oceanobacillus sp.]
FHAGTELKDGQVVTAGGRVLAVSGRASDLPTALQRAYAHIEHIHFEGMHYRHDIGQAYQEQES